MCQKNSSTTKAKHCLESLCISKQILNALTGFELQFVEILLELIPKSEYEILPWVITSIFYMPKLDNFLNHKAKMVIESPDISKTRSTV